MDKLAEIPRVFSTQNADGTYSIIGNWFTYANFTVATAIFGFSFLIACVATAAYYTLVVVTDPSQQGSSRVKREIESHLTSSLLSDWNFELILRFLYFAYTTYSTLDLESIECQNKIICEFQETEGIVGKTTRHISRFLLFFNIFDTVPYIKEYQEAVRRGQRRSDVRKTTNENETLADGNDESCETFYPECAFSVERFNNQFSGVFWST